MEYLSGWRSNYQTGNNHDMRNHWYDHHVFYPVSQGRRESPPYVGLCDLVGITIQSKSQNHTVRQWNEQYQDQKLVQQCWYFVWTVYFRYVRTEWWHQIIWSANHGESTSNEAICQFVTQAVEGDHCRCHLSIQPDTVCLKRLEIPLRIVLFLCFW